MSHSDSITFFLEELNQNFIVLHSNRRHTYLQYQININHMKVHPIHKKGLVSIPKIKRNNFRLSIYYSGKSN